MDDPDLALDKVTISGPTLSSLLHHFTSSHGPTHGFLFGHFSLLTPTTLSDDDPSPPPSSLIATITSFTTTTTTTTNHPNSTIIGCFSTRRLSPLRPSLLDHSHCNSLFLPTSLFLLITSSATYPTIHTHDFRAYRFLSRSLSFEPASLEVVNVGPAFRGQYSNFTPKSDLPWLPPRVGSPMREDSTLRGMKTAEHDQAKLNAYVAGGYEVGSLGRLMGSDAAGYTSGVEELYDKMLSKLKGLAKAVETSSATVLQLENRNAKLRRRVAGIE